MRRRKSRRPNHRIPPHHQHRPRPRPRPQLAPLPESILLLLRSPAARQILHQLSMPMLSFYKDLLKTHYIHLHQHNAGSKRMYQSFLLLLREIVVAQRVKIAAKSIQRKVRKHLATRKYECALIIQCWRHTFVANARMKMQKALRFIRRMANRQLLKTLILWHKEARLSNYLRKNVGKKTNIFRKWCKYTDAILDFKAKMKARWMIRLNKPMLRAWWGYTKKIQSVRAFVLRIIMGEKRKILYTMKFFVIAKQKGTKLQNWMRCVNAKYKLFRLKVQALAKVISFRTIRTSGISVTIELRWRGAVAFQKIWRSYDDRIYSHEYRQTRIEEFNSTVIQWKKATKLAGEQAVDIKLDKLNNNKKKSSTHSKRKSRKLRRLQSDDTIRSNQKDNKRSFARLRFGELDAFKVGRIPLSAGGILFDRGGLHLSTTEKELTAGILATGEKQQIYVDDWEAFFDSGIVYESSTTPVSSHVSAIASAVRGSQLYAIRQLRVISGEASKRRQDRKALAEAQIEGQLEAWDQHELNKIFCLNCRRHFCFSTELLFTHLRLSPSVLRTEHRPDHLMKTHQFSCPFFPGITEKTKVGRLAQIFGNDILFSQVQKFGHKHAHAMDRLRVGGLLETETV